MGSLFGKSNQTESRITAQDAAILQVKQLRDILKQQQKRIGITLEKDRLIARKLIRDGKKDRAKLLLRKKKFLEMTLEKTDTQLENIEKIVYDIEFSQVEMQVLNGLKTGNAALKKVHMVLNVDEVERILEETKAGVSKQKEISKLLTGELSQKDEGDVMEELNDIIASQLPEVPSKSDEIINPPSPVKPEKNTDNMSPRERRREKCQLPAS